MSEYCLIYSQTELSCQNMHRQNRCHKQWFRIGEKTVIEEDWVKFTPSGFSTNVYRMGQQTGYMKNSTEKQEEALKEYTTGESLWINRACRNVDTMGDTNQAFRNRVLSQGDALSELVRGAPMNREPQVVFRGADRAPPMAYMWNKPDFTSTSNKWDQADGFREGDCCMWIIQIPTGASVLEIGCSHTSCGYDEGEVLLDRNSVFSLDKIQERGNSEFGVEVTYYYMTLKL